MSIETLPKYGGCLYWLYFSVMLCGLDGVTNNPSLLRFTYKTGSNSKALARIEKRYNRCYTMQGVVVIMSFADSIIKLRSEMRISQKELADELNVSCASVNRWENGRTVPNKMTMFVIREYGKSHGIDFACEGDKKKRGDAV